MGLESYIRDSLTRAHDLVTDFREGGKIVTDGCSRNRLHRYELLVKSLISYYGTSSVVPFSKGQPHIFQIINIINVNADTNGVCIVNYGHYILMVLDIVYPLEFCCSSFCWSCSRSCEGRYALSSIDDCLCKDGLEHIVYIAIPGCIV
jgi:hypothetical protein